MGYIRTATMKDVDQLMLIMEKVFAESKFKDCNYVPTEAYKNTVTAILFDNMYATVYESGGVVKGALIAMVGENHWGVRNAIDLFFYSEGGSHLLIKDYIKWARSQGVEFIQLNDFTGNRRFHKLIERFGLKKTGTVFVGE